MPRNFLHHNGSILPSDVDKDFYCVWEPILDKILCFWAFNGNILRSDGYINVDLAVQKRKSRRYVKISIMGCNTKFNVFTCHHYLYWKIYYSAGIRMVDAFSTYNLIRIFHDDRRLLFLILFQHLHILGRLQICFSKD